MPFENKDKLKGLQKGYEESGMDTDPIVNKIKGFFSSDEPQENGKDAQLEAIKRKREAMGA